MKLIFLAVNHSVTGVIAAPENRRLLPDFSAKEICYFPFPSSPYWAPITMICGHGLPLLPHNAVHGQGLTKYS